MDQRKGQFLPRRGQDGLNLFSGEQVCRRLRRKNTNIPAKKPRAKSLESRIFSLPVNLNSAPAFLCLKIKEPAKGFPEPISAPESFLKFLLKTPARGYI
ncbi:MAG TPA: hypothetical protein ENM97_05365 [Moorella mulderi]|nr:hypothetical protein [Moorella mulderi]